MCCWPWKGSMPPLRWPLRRMEDYAAAKQTLNRLHRGSLGEGMEETLTVHRLHVPMKLRKTMANTNVIESAFSIVEKV